MYFKRLASLIIEAKGEKPGQRYFNARHSSGPAGISNTPVGRSDYNPELFKHNTNAVPDTKAKSVRDGEMVLRNAFRVIKGSMMFRNRLNKLLEGYAKKRKQIKTHHEEVLSNNPKHIDDLFGQKERLKKIIAALGADPRTKEYKIELQSVQERMDEAQEELDGVYEQMSEVIGTNEENSGIYVNEVVTLIQQTAEEEYDQLLADMSDREKATITLQSLENLEDTMLDDEELDKDELRLSLLSVLQSDDQKQNPLLIFFDTAREKYQEAKGTDVHFAGVARNTQNISLEMLYNRLPMSNFIYFYNASKDDLPVMRMTRKRRKQLRVASPVTELLSKITSPEDWETQKINVRDMVADLNIDDDRMKGLLNVIDGPYKRRGVTVIQKLQGMLKGILKEDVMPEYLAQELFEEILTTR
jgi:hypothetical protein